MKRQGKKINKAAKSIMATLKGLLEYLASNFNILLWNCTTILSFLACLAKVKCHTTGNLKSWVQMACNIIL